MTVAAAPTSTRSRLVDTARAYLDAEGVEGIGLREIARRAGVSHGAPLRHFPTLGALLAAVAAEGFRDLHASVDAAVRTRSAADDPFARLRAAAHGYVDFARRNPGVFALMFRRDLCDVADPDYLTAGGIAFGQLVALVADAQAGGLRPDVPAAELAGVVWATVHGLASLHLHDALVPTTGQADLDVLVDLATEFLIPTAPSGESIPTDSKESP
jgi:AcrR family transcriptional regulator